MGICSAKWCGAKFAESVGVRVLLSIWSTDLKYVQQCAIQTQREIVSHSYKIKK